MKRILAYILLILAFFLVQNNIFAASSLILTVPNLLLILVFSIGFIRGSFEGMLIGFACGLLNDLFFGSILGFSALMYTILGYGMGMIGNLYYTDFVNMPLILCLFSMLIYHIGTYLFAFLIPGRGGFGVYLSKVAIPELLYTGLMTLVLYPLLRKIEALIEKWELRKPRTYV